MTAHRHLILADCGLDGLVLSLTALAALRAYHGEDHLTLWTRKEALEFATLSPYADEVKCMPDVPWQFRSEAKALHSHFAETPYGRVYDLFPSEQTDRLHKIVEGIPLVRGRAGQADWSGPYKNATFSTLALSGGLHTEQRLLAQIAAAGIPPDVHADLSWVGSQVAQFKLPVALDKRLTLIVLDAHRGWPLDRVQEFVGTVVNAGRTPALLGDSGVAGRLQDLGVVAENLTGQASISDVVCLAWAAEAAVGPDTGLTHLIARAGCRTALLFGPGSDPAIRKPRQSSATVLQRHDLAAITVREVIQTLGLHLNVVDNTQTATGSPFDAA